MSSKYKDVILNLESEHKLLVQLLYRNHNQHRSTKLFDDYKAMSRSLEHLSSEKLTTTLERLEDSLRSASLTKVTSSDLRVLFAGQTLTCGTIHMISMALQSCLRCSSLVRRQIGKRIFLPLYSMLLAITARLFACLASLHGHLYEQGSALESHLKHLELTQPRLAGAIAEHFAQPLHKFTELTQHIHQKMNNPTNASANAANKPTSISQSTKEKKAASSVVEGALSRSQRNVSSASLHSTGSAAQAYPSSAEDDTGTGDVGAMCTDAAAEDAMEDAGLLIGEASALTVPIAPPEVPVHHTKVTPKLAKVKSSDGGDSIGNEDNSTAYDWLISPLSHIDTSSSSTKPQPQPQKVSSATSLPPHGDKVKKLSSSEKVKSGGEIIKLKRKAEDQHNDQRSVTARDTEERQAKKHKKKHSSVDGGDGGSGNRSNADHRNGKSSSSSKKGKSGGKDAIDDIFGGL